MTTASLRSMSVMAVLAAITVSALPASAMTASPVARTLSLLHPINWSDRVRGRTSSSTPALGYGWLWGDADVDPRYRRGYRHQPAYGYDRSVPAPYGYQDGAY